MEDEQSFGRQYADKVKRNMLRSLDTEHGDHHLESLKHWRAWGSWFSWGSPVGLDFSSSR